MQWKEYKYGDRRPSLNSDLLASNDFSFHIDNGFNNSYPVYFKEGWFESHMREYVSVYYKCKVIYKLGILLLLFNEVLLMLRVE